MTRFSFIVPFHRDLDSLTRCLTALARRPGASDVIVAADGAREDCRGIARAHGARVIAIDGPAGPAAARNAAAAEASGDVLVFVDADVVVSPSGLERLAQIFREQPSTTAVFGAYDDDPAHPGFVSQYKNLSHAFVHRASPGRTQTFWAGFGAIRREAFQAVGGFDERFRTPSVEDIDIGYRLTAAGYEVRLDPALTGCHLKRWTLGRAIVSDVRDRGVPWAQLILRYGVRSDHLNISAIHRWSLVLAWLMLATGALAFYDIRATAALPALVAAFGAVNWRYYRSFRRARGVWFAARVLPLHILHHWCNGVSLAAGVVLFTAARYLRLRLPHSLSADSWSA